MTQNYYESFCFNRSDLVILRDRKTYEKTASGKNWKSAPVAGETEIMNDDQYSKFIRSIPWFNNDPFGGYCRAKQGTTKYGYLPVRVVTVSPYRIEKHIDSFTFLSKYDLFENAGYRETYIFDHARSWEKLDGCNGHEIIVFYTDETGDCCSGEFDLTAKKWVG